MTGNLNALTDHVVDRARQAAEAIIARGQTKADQITAQGEKQSQEAEDDLVRVGTVDVQSIHRKIVSQARLRLKREILEARNQILDRILTETESRLQRFSAEEGEAFVRSVVELVGSESEGEEGDEVVIYLSAQDAKHFETHLSEALAAEIGLKRVEIRSSEIRGGVIVEIATRHLQIDASFDQLLREAASAIERVVEEEIFSTAEVNEAQRRGEAG